MKKGFRLSTLWLSITLVFVLTFAAAMIPATQNFTGSSFHLGFPSVFFTVHVSQSHGFVTHLNLSGLLIDIGLTYMVCTLIEWVCSKRKTGVSQ